MRLTIAPLVVLFAATAVSAAPVSDLSPARRDAAAAPADLLHDRRDATVPRGKVDINITQTKAQIAKCSQDIAELQKVLSRLGRGSAAYSSIIEAIDRLKAKRARLQEQLRAYEKASEGGGLGGNLDG